MINLGETILFVSVFIQCSHSIFCDFIDTFHKLHNLVALIYVGDVTLFWFFWVK